MSQPLARSQKILWGLLALTPLLLLVYWLAKFASNVPYLDDWELVPYLIKSYTGHISPGDLWMQYLENRILFPLLVLIPLAHLSDWNINLEVAGIVLLAGFMFLLLARLAVRTFREYNQKTPPWLLILISFLIFSLIQYESWCFGFTIIGFISLSAAIGGLALLAWPCFAWLRFWGALLAGTVAVYSFSSGILFWVVGLLPLGLALRQEPYRRRWIPLAIWVSWIIMLLTFFYHGYQKPSQTPSLLFLVCHPQAALTYFLAFLGNPIANTLLLPLWVPVGVGLTGLMLFGLSALICFRQKSLLNPITSFWISLGAYAVLGALAVTFARSGYGSIQALTTRYIVLSNLFWIATLLMTLICLRHLSYLANQPGYRRALASLKAMLLLLLLICAGLFALSSIQRLTEWQKQHEAFLDARDELLSDLPNHSLLLRIYWEPNRLKERIEFLTRYRLSLFHDKKPFQEYKAIEVAAGNLEGIRWNSPPAAGFNPNRVLITGRAYDPGNRRPARAVLLVNSQAEIVARSSVSAAEDFRMSSWQAELSAAKLSPGPIQLELYALLQTDDLIAAIGSLNIEMPEPVDQELLTPITFSDPAPALVGFSDHLQLAGDQVYGCGWARNPITGKPADWVIVVDETNRILAYTQVGEERADVAWYLNNPDMLRSGWRLAFRLPQLSPGSHQLQAYLFLPEEHKALKLRNGLTIRTP